MPKTCNKHPHKSKGAAQAHLRALERLHGENFDPRYQCYPCPYCKEFWHVGRLGKKWKKIIEKTGSELKCGNS